MASLRISDGRTSFFQWDLNQKLIIENPSVCNKVHFTNNSRDTALVKEVKTDENGLKYVDVPNSLLTVPINLEVYLYQDNGDCKTTVSKYVFDVVKRKKPENYVYTEDEHKDFDQLLSEMEENLELTKQYRDEAMSTEIGTVRTDLETERNARIEADIVLSTRLQKVEVASSVNRYEIDNLKAKAEGKLYRTETVEAEAYTVDVPSSVAPYAEVQKIGGKTVVWNQMLNAFSNDATVINSFTIEIKGNISTYPIVSKSIYIPNGHKAYYKIKAYSYNGWRTSQKGDLPYVYISELYAGYSNLITGTGNESYVQLRKDTNYDESTTKICFNLIDLTQMFGSGNEPTLDECKKIFSADYYPYDAGTLKSFPVRTVRSFNAEGTEIGSIDVSFVTSDLKSTIDVADEWGNGKIIRRVGSRSYTSGDESESNYITDGTTTYYPLDTPTEETVPEIENYINVEGGGTLTFESDDTVHMPVPSTDRFIVDLS